jgi:hypothetical protein
VYVGLSYVVGVWILLILYKDFRVALKKCLYTGKPVSAINGKRNGWEVLYNELWCKLH